MIEENSHAPVDLIQGAMSREDLENVLKQAIEGANISLERFLNPFALSSLKAEKYWVSSYSNFSWVRVRSNMWALSLTDGEVLTIEKNGN